MDSSAPNYPPPPNPPPNRPPPSVAASNNTLTPTSQGQEPTRPPHDAPNTTATDASTTNYPPPPDPPPNFPPPSPAGYRIALSTDTPFPPRASLPPTALHDLGGPEQAVYVGSAIFATSVHPCKLVPGLTPPVRVPYAGQEYEHWGRFDLLPIDPAMMEWVPAVAGRVPPGRRPVEGGFEEDGRRLFHALAQMNGVWVPGKAGEHLEGANIPFGGEKVVRENYQILCWKS